MAPRNDQNRNQDPQNQSGSRTDKQNTTRKSSAPKAEKNQMKSEKNKGGNETNREQR